MQEISEIGIILVSINKLTNLSWFYLLTIHIFTKLLPPILIDGEGVRLQMSSCMES